MSSYRDIEKALAEAGFVERAGKHRVFRHPPSGTVVVIPKTPSDSRRGFFNDRAVVRRALAKASAK